MMVYEELLCKKVDFRLVLQRFLAANDIHFSKEGDRWVSFEAPKDHNDAEIDFPTITSTRTTPTTLATTTPLFFVIEDPREARRLARIQRLKEAGFIMEPITKTTSATRTTTARTTTPSWLEDFTLPEVTDRIAAFALSNGAKLKDYKWFGVYDRCAQVSAQSEKGGLLDSCPIDLFQRAGSSKRGKNYASIWMVA